MADKDAVFLSPHKFRGRSRSRPPRGGRHAAIVESIRAGLVFSLKEAVGAGTIKELEESLAQSALDSWTQNPRILVLGNPELRRVSIVSLGILSPRAGSPVGMLHLPLRPRHGVWHHRDRPRRPHVTLEHLSPALGRVVAPGLCAAAPESVLPGYRTEAAASWPRRRRIRPPSRRSGSSRPSSSGSVGFRCPTRRPRHSA